jgi:tRNA (mo5U34)-methyltransferase
MISLRRIDLAATARRLLRTEETHRMGVTLTKDCLRLDRTFSQGEHSRYQHLIEERRSWGYYQRLEICDAAGARLSTPGHHLCQSGISLLDTHGFPQDFTGKTVLDIGCNAGFYSFVAKLRGARSVVGLDLNPHYIDQANLMKEILGIDVEFSVGEGHTLDPAVAMFDVVINTGVIYHLQNPMDFLSRVSAITRELMFLESEMLTDPVYSDYALFIEKEYGGDLSNWWIYGPRCAERMARAAGFPHVKFEGFIWTPPANTKTQEGFLRQGRGALTCRK